jgi:membrane protein YdbS with pleckstrin-like domain
MAIVVTVAAIILAFLSPPAAIAAAIGVAVLWLALLVTFVYRRLNANYTLTTQRLLHKSGILLQRANRIEVIDIDDVTYVQGIIERLFGVGTIKLLSTDTSDPTLVLYGIDNVQQVANLIDNARREERRKRGLYMEAV